MSILWEPSGETGEPLRDVRGLSQRAENRQEQCGVSATDPRPLHHRDEAPAVPAILVAYVACAMSGGVVGLVIGYALGVLR